MWIPNGTQIGDEEYESGDSREIEGKESGGRIVILRIIGSMGTQSTEVRDWNKAYANCSMVDHIWHVGQYARNRDAARTEDAV